MSPMMTMSYTALDSGWQLRTFRAKTEHATSIVPSINVCRTACVGSRARSQQQSQKRWGNKKSRSHLKRRALRWTPKKSCLVMIAIINTMCHRSIRARLKFLCEAGDIPIYTNFDQKKTKVEFRLFRAKLEPKLHYDTRYTTPPFYYVLSRALCCPVQECKMRLMSTL